MISLQLFCRSGMSRKRALDLANPLSWRNESLPHTAGKVLLILKREVENRDLGELSFFGMGGGGGSELAVEGVKFYALYLLSIQTFFLTQFTVAQIVKRIMKSQVA